MTKGRSGKLVASWSLEWNSSMVSVEFCREREKTHESMWKALAYNITYWKLSYIPAWSWTFWTWVIGSIWTGHSDRKHKNKDALLFQLTKQISSHIIRKAFWWKNDLKLLPCVDINHRGKSLWFLCLCAHGFWLSVSAKWLLHITLKTQICL